MNARQMLAKLDGYGGIIPFNSEELDVTLRALRLLAAADGGEGTALERLIEMKVMAPAPSGSGPSTVRTVVSVYLDDLVALEQRCAGLAARVRELEADIVATYDKCMAIVEASNSSGDECCISAVEKAVDAIDAARSAP